MPGKFWFYALFSGLLLALPWYDSFPGYMLHFSLLPLLICEQYFYEQKIKSSSGNVFFIFLAAFFAWNLFTMWWVFAISKWGALFSIFTNSMFYAIVFWLFHAVKRILGEVPGWVAFVAFWLSFEFYCLHAEFAQPWVILGNGLAHEIKGIQWYEYSGSLGGSLWILLGNIVSFNLYQFILKQHIKKIAVTLVLGILLWLVPYFVSVRLYHQPEPDGKICKVALLQPNIDPYTEKFNSMSQKAQLERILNLADSIKNDSIDYYLAPETAIDNGIWESNLLNNYSLFAIREFVYKHPKSAFIIGAITYNEIEKVSDCKATTRYDTINKMHFDAYNTAIQIDTSFNTMLYHKSKLVLGVEKVPFPGVLRFMDKYLLNLGGSEGSLGQQDEPSIFSHNNGLFKPAPVICFESVYGEYNTQYVKKGANMLFIITNDGWWNGTVGYTQHLRYSQIRAIETRRYVARCANTGISAFINSKGVIEQSTDWWKQTAITGDIRTNDERTFYVTYGDYIGRIAIGISILLLLVFVVKWIIVRRNT